MCLYCLSLIVLSVILMNFSHQHSCSPNYVLRVCTDEENMPLSPRHLGDSGIDLIVPDNYELQPFSYQWINYHGIYVLTEASNSFQSYSYSVVARSSMTKKGIILVNGISIIDAGYRGNLSSLIYNSNNYTITIPKNSRITQIIASNLAMISVVADCHVPDYGTRKTNGFGSTS